MITMLCPATAHLKNGIIATEVATYMHVSQVAIVLSKGHIILANLSQITGWSKAILDFTLI